MTIFVETLRVLKCDVTIDRIKRIEMITRTREIYAFDAPEMLEVRALDDFGNLASFHILRLLM